ncbi:YdcF family protein [Mesorhizobium sp. ASY16-5R]|uniref:YdcF family protein n=1 Tax=Mesorhizobium sp. ASY16-5R TaxID=3445772 RepID=UPI003FA16A37
METNSRDSRGTGHGRRPRLFAILRVSTLAVVAAAGLFAGGFGLFGTYVSKLTTPADVEPADAIIVLTGGQARLDAAIDLLKTGKGRRLLISGVNPVASRESLRAATGSDKALFSCCVDIDTAALDTIGNAEESAKWVQSHDYGSVILVTNNYHMPRSLLEMNRLVENTALQPYPVVNTRLDDGSWLTKPDALRVIFTEYTKYVAALARSVVSPAEVMADDAPRYTATIHKPDPATP